MLHIPSVIHSLPPSSPGNKGVILRECSELIAEASAGWWRPWLDCQLYLSRQSGDGDREFCQVGRAPWSTYFNGPASIFRSKTNSPNLILGVTNPTPPGELPSFRLQFLNYSNTPASYRVLQGWSICVGQNPEMSLHFSTPGSIILQSMGFWMLCSFVKIIMMNITRKGWDTLSQLQKTSGDQNWRCYQYTINSIYS